MIEKSFRFTLKLIFKRLNRWVGLHPQPGAHLLNNLVVIYAWAIGEIGKLQLDNLCVLAYPISNANLAAMLSRKSLHLIYRDTKPQENGGRSTVCFFRKS